MYAQFITQMLEPTDRLANAEDEFGNSRVRLLFLQQWASSACESVCGLRKRKMMRCEEGYEYAHIDGVGIMYEVSHDEEVEPSTEEYHLNEWSEDREVRFVGADSRPFGFM
eukprot:55169-Eustigmatos_ZCMA.PRE.1